VCESFLSSSAVKGTFTLEKWGSYVNQSIKLGLNYASLKICMIAIFICDHFTPGEETEGKPKSTIQKIKQFPVCIFLFRLAPQINLALFRWAHHWRGLENGNMRERPISDWSNRSL
jgi:hypothetical protein